MNPWRLVIAGLELAFKVIDLVRSKRKSDLEHDAATGEAAGRSAAEASRRAGHEHDTP